MIKLDRLEFAKRAKKLSQNNENDNYFKDVYIIDEDFAKGRMVDAKIEEGVQTTIIDTYAKEDFAVYGTTPGKVLKISAIIDGDFLKVDNISGKKVSHEKGFIIIEYIKEEDSIVYQNKDVNLQYIHITLRNNYLDQNPYLYNILKKNDNKDFVIKFFEPKLEQYYGSIFDYPYDSSIDKYLLKNKTMDLIYLALNNCQKVDEEKEKKSFINDDDILRIEKIKKRLEVDYASKLTIPYLAKSVALNEFKLKKGFKYLYNTTIHNYLKQIRLEKSIELLKTQKYTVTEVALMVGYSGQSSFTYAFSQRYNFPPKSFLK